MTATPRPTRRLLLAAGAGAASLAACSTDPPAAPGATPSPEQTSPPAPAATPTRPASTGPTGPPRIALAPGPDITHGPRTVEAVALTFHGQGTAAVTDTVLAACREAGAQVTVFAVGTWVEADPAQVRALHAAGHEIGNHTWSHQPMRHLSRSSADAEITRGRRAVADALGSPGWWFRPSGTPSSTPTIRAAALAAGYGPCVSYDVDPRDYQDPGATLVRSRTRAAVQPGSIVSLHLGHAGTAEALPGILTDLHRLGLRPVTLSTLLRDV